MDKPNNQKPVKIGEKHIVTIESEGTKGDGVTRINNYTIIINKAKIGQKLEIQITATYEKFGFAKIIREIKEKTATEIMEQLDKEE